MLHAKDETFQELRAAALKFESQQAVYGTRWFHVWRRPRAWSVEDGAEEEYQEDQWIEAVRGKGPRSVTSVQGWSLCKRMSDGHDEGQVL